MRVAQQTSTGLLLKNGCIWSLRSRGYRAWRFRRSSERHRIYTRWSDTTKLGLGWKTFILSDKVGFLLNAQWLALWLLDIFPRLGFCPLPLGV